MLGVLTPRSLTLAATGETLTLVLTLLAPLAAVAVGVWVYLDARRWRDDDLPPYLGFVVGGLFLAGTVPGLVALAVAADPAVQGFPTALRVLPGGTALVVYLFVRPRRG